MSDRGKKACPQLMTNGNAQGKDSDNMGAPTGQKR